jgi:cell wall-associated NlpC family hydrolase
MTLDRTKYISIATLVGASLLGPVPARGDHDDREWRSYRYEKRMQSGASSYRTERGRDGNASVPPSRVAEGAFIGHRAADHALRVMGTPYRYGGDNPSSGFDCSGLVQFSYNNAGASVPRTTQALRQASARISSSDLRRGDLVFFHQGRKKNGHVGIYLGAGEFIHAPSSGGRVRKDSLQSPYWRKHFSEARRIAV